MSVMTQNDPSLARHGDKAGFNYDELLFAIGKERDQAAFQKLYTHILSPAFGVASYLTRRREEAEEAVQEAMIRIWNSAHTYKPGKGKSWILRIVAREAIRVRKKDIRYTEVVQDATDPHQTPSGNSTLKSMENQELKNAVQVQMASLSKQDRTLAAFYFGAGMTQDEISSELQIPQRTISFKLNSILSTLKKNLAKAGFASLEASLLAEVTSTVICTPATPPQPKPLESFLNRKPESLEPDPFTFRTHASTLIVGALIFVSIATFITTVSLAPESQPNLEQPAESNQNLHEKSAPEIQTLPAPPLLKKIWTFENGIPEGFEFFAGKGKIEPSWVHPGKKVLCPELVDTIFRSGKKLRLRAMMIQLPVILKSKFYRIDIQAIIPPHSQWSSKQKNLKISVGMGLNLRTLQGELVPRKTWSNKLKAAAGNIYDYRMFILDNYAVTNTGQRSGPAQMYKFQKDFPDTRPVIGSNWLQIERIELNEITQDQIPAPLRNIEQYLKFQTKSK